MNQQEMCKALREALLILEKAKAGREEVVARKHVERLCNQLDAIDGALA